MLLGEQIRWPRPQPPRPLWLQDPNTRAQAATKAQALGTNMPCHATRGHTHAHQKSHLNSRHFSKGRILGTCQNTGSVAQMYTPASDAFSGQESAPRCGCVEMGHRALPISPCLPPSPLLNHNHKKRLAISHYRNRKPARVSQGLLHHQRRASSSTAVSPEEGHLAKPRIIFLSLSISKHVLFVHSHKKKNPYIKAIIKCVPYRKNVPSSQNFN